MRKRTAILIANIILTLAFASQAWARSWSTEQIYEATKEACTRTSEQDVFVISMKADQLRIGHFQSARFNELLNDVQLRSTASSFESLEFFSTQKYVFLFLESPGFKAAVDECYPRNDRMRAFFEKSLRRADLRGRSSAAALFAGMGFGIGGAVTKAIPLLGAFGKYVTYTLNFVEVSGILYGAYAWRSQYVDQTKMLKDQCGSAEGEALNACKKAQMMKGLEKIETVLQEKNNETAAMRELLVNSAEEDIVKLKLAREKQRSPQDLRRIDELILQRQSFLQKYGR